ncbi:hypothetical protein SNL152K_7633 [Streptomyces sp. NL15-2K]|nr:hypothetical protein SNL152K_7633 [Streptomyces sp. NL15-2K]
MGEPGRKSQGNGTRHGAPVVSSRAGVSLRATVAGLWWGRMGAACGLHGRSRRWREWEGRISGM